MAEELSFIFIYSQFEKGFMHKAPGKGTSTLFMSHRQNKQKTWFVDCKFPSSEITESPFKGDFRNHADLPH